MEQEKVVDLSAHRHRRRIPAVSKTAYEEAVDQLESLRSLITDAPKKVSPLHANARWEACFTIVKKICAYIYEPPADGQGYADRKSTTVELFSILMELPESEERFSLFQCIRVWILDGQTSGRED